jgi:AraC family transcriptional regulator
MFVTDTSFKTTPTHSAEPSRAGSVFSHNVSMPAPAHSGERGTRQQPCAGRYQVDISPPEMIQRRITAGAGLAVEIVQSMRCDRIEHRFCAPLHLLVICEHGARQEGETFVGDLPRSTLHNPAGKLTFVPAGKRYHEWQQPRTPTSLIYFYFEPAAFEAAADVDAAERRPLSPRLFFENKTLWDTALKLKGLAESPAPEDRLYFDALGVVLIHELIRLDQGAHRSEPLIKGGLAAWQQRAVTAYIEEHLAEPIPLLTLAQLARLSPHYFCRAFKQSFGLPPHRYHSILRIERAKALLAGSAHSVTEIGLKLGFGETSSFSTAFRKATGLTATAYQRTLG